MQSVHNKDVEARRSGESLGDLHAVRPLVTVRGNSTDVLCRLTSRPMMVSCRIRASARDVVECVISVDLLISVRLEAFEPTTHAIHYTHVHLDPQLEPLRLHKVVSHAQQANSENG